MVVTTNVEKKLFDLLFVMLAVIVPHHCSLAEDHSLRILYKRYNQCKQTLDDDCNTFKVSIRQQRMRKS